MSGPLDGIRVLELGQIYQGPYCGLLLSYLGADVIKVEPPWGENVRTRSEDGKPPQYQYLNPTKDGITLNLKTEKGKNALRRLAEKADVFVENYSTGTMDSLGLGYDDLREVNPELIYAHGSGYGDYGPYADYPAMDLTIQAMSGTIHTTGFPDQPPVKAGPSVCDFIGGVHLAVGVVSALYERTETDEGDYIEVGMYDCMYPTMASPVASWVDRVDAPPRTGNRHTGLAIAPYNVYEVEDGYVALICISEHHWEELATLMGREDMIGDERFSSKVKRAQHQVIIDDVVGSWLDGRKKDDVVGTLLGRDIPCSPVQTVEELVDDPHLKDRNMINYLENQGTGREEIPVPGSPIKFAGSDDPVVTSAPELGEHTEEILTEVAGYSQDEIDEMANENSI